MSCLDLWERDLQSYCNKAVQTSGNLEALEKRMAMTEGVLVHAGLWEIRAELRQMNEKIVTIQGNWEAAIAKLQGYNSESTNVWAQLQSVTQELETKLTHDRTLLIKQSTQVEKVETNCPKNLGRFHDEGAKLCNVGQWPKQDL